MPLFDKILIAVIAACMVWQILIAPAVRQRNVELLEKQKGQPK
jgi:hypothetical protein